VLTTAALGLIASLDPDPAPPLEEA